MVAYQLAVIVGSRIPGFVTQWPSLIRSAALETQVPGAVGAGAGPVGQRLVGLVGRKRGGRGGIEHRLDEAGARADHDDD